VVLVVLVAGVRIVAARFGVGSKRLFRGGRQ
jgi:hypothetical protein